jgi:hypothetical protein
MNKQHIHADVIKAWADGAKIQVRSCSSLCENKWSGWCNVEQPEWHKHQEYRVKPEPKPDFVYYGQLDESARGRYNLGSCFTSDRDRSDQLKLTFDGETGKLKSAEIL